MGPRCFNTRRAWWQDAKQWCFSMPTTRCCGDTSSQHAASKKLGISCSAVSLCVNGHQRIYQGFRLRHESEVLAGFIREVPKEMLSPYAALCTRRSACRTRRCTLLCCCPRRLRWVWMMIRRFREAIIVTLMGTDFGLGSGDGGCVSNTSSEARYRPGPAVAPRPRQSKKYSG